MEAEKVRVQFIKKTTGISGRSRKFGIGGAAKGCGLGAVLKPQGVGVQYVKSSEATDHEV